MDKPWTSSGSFTVGISTFSSIFFAGLEGAQVMPIREQTLLL